MLTLATFPYSFKLGLKGLRNMHIYTQEHMTLTCTLYMHKDAHHFSTFESQCLVLKDS